MDQFDTYDPKIYYNPGQSEPQKDPEVEEKPKPKASMRPAKQRKPKAAAKPVADGVPISERVVAWFHSTTLRLVAGIFLMCLSAYLTVAFVSFLANCIADQSAIYNVEMGTATGVHNAAGEGGARLSNFLIDGCFGLGSCVIVVWTLLMGLKLLINKPRFKSVNFTIKCLVALITISLIVGLLTIAIDTVVNWGGTHGRYVNEFIVSFFGWTGGVILCIFMIALFVVICMRDIILWVMRIRRRQARIKAARLEAKQKEEEKNRLIAELKEQEERDARLAGEHKPAEAGAEESFEDPGQVQFAGNSPEAAVEEDPFPEEDDIYYTTEKTEQDSEPETSAQTQAEESETQSCEQQEGKPEGEGMVVNVVNAAEGAGGVKVAAAQGKPPYKFPPFEILREGKTRISVDETEQAENQDLIRRTLLEYNIPITSIEATVGPTVTLYEIVPDKGVRINRIRNLSDDIAVRIKAIGVRIIAPIPGKGTVGIEVPNKDPQMVTMRQVIKSRKFEESKAELPIALGLTISRGVYMADLAKMPHLLVAGATGQGKSVGLNAIIASLLYSKSPDELKFVMVDPKTVEFSLYERIENHYLAKIPDSEESIITRMDNVVATLSSLCVEMESRYDLLRKARVRNIVEYNNKYKQHTLLPTEGHRFLPYIVVVVDEFADLMMTVGKEAEIPIARLAQKARAIGIHVIIATQRPSANVITGIIKANFPARISFKVSSGVESKIILDTSGAQQLIGRGDMLISNSSDLVRVQCAFIDTPEVEELCKYIESAPYPTGPYILPEPEHTEEGSKSVDAGGMPVERDPLFFEIARSVVNSNTASTSSLQRTYGLGYARAGRIMDQLERAKIVGPSQGGKPRNVLVDPITLESILEKC